MTKIIASLFSVLMTFSLFAEGLPQNLIPVPLTVQDTNYTCGVAALQSLLYYYDKNEIYNEPELAKTLNSNHLDGTLTKNIISFAKSHGFFVTKRLYMTLDELKYYIDSKTPVLVLLQSWATSEDVDWKNDWVDGHFSIVVGYDDNNIYFMDPSTLGNYTYIPTEEFLDRWHDVDGRTRTYQLGLILKKPSVDYNPSEIIRMK